MAHDLGSMLEFEEGRVARAYPDPLTHGDPWTIGVGHTGPEVHQGLMWTNEQIDGALEADCQRAIAICKTIPWFVMLDDSHDFRPSNARQCVLVGMAFQMGAKLLEFHQTLAAVRDEHWADAAVRMLDSAWARQTPGRARRMARQMETGQWQ